MTNTNTEIQKTLTAFREVTRELDNTYSIFPKSCGLSEVEYFSLMLIYEGVATQSQICDRLYFSPTTLNSAFKQLRKKGLIRLEPYEENQRSKQTFLTETGKEFVEKYILKMHQIEERAWRGMTEEEHKNLLCLTRKLNSLLFLELKNLKTDTDE